MKIQRLVISLTVVNVLAILPGSKTAAKRQPGTANHVPAILKSRDEASGPGDRPHAKAAQAQDQKSRATSGGSGDVIIR